jgi:hypothetical protein
VGELEPGGKDLKLYAKGIKLNPSATNEVGKFHLTIDGLERALWYKTEFVAEGQTRIATRYNDPQVGFEAKAVVAKDQPAKLVVAFTVDNAPADARLAFHLEQKNKEGQFISVVTPFDETAKRQHIGFDPAGPDGAMQFEASRGDWTREFSTRGISGPVRLRADLFSPRSVDALATYETTQVLDDAPPKNATVQSLAHIEKGTTRLPVSGTVTPPQSGIAAVGFIVGTKEDFAKPEVEAKAVPGKRKGSDGSSWEATLALTTTEKGKIIVTARFTSGVGLHAFDSTEVEILEPVPSPEEVAVAKPVPKKPGGIKGKVTENDIAQPGLDVFLYDAKEKDIEKQPKKQVKTKPDGTYAFADLDPGLYRVYCLKSITNRSDAKDVNVPSGETVPQDLDLILP